MFDFKFTEELIDRIIYGMENQGEGFLFDLRQCDIVAKNDLEGDPEDIRYAEIPVWDSAKGFQLMEKFVVTLRNPVYRQRLQEALTGGKGVFRKFKDVLNERKDIERLWFSFKEREMRREVKEWYELTCERLGLEKLGEEPEETEDLIITDFVIRDGSGDDLDYVKRKDREAFSDMFPDEEQHIVQEHYRHMRADAQIESGKGNDIQIIETPLGEPAGFIWGSENGPVIRVHQIFIEKTFRGLGLAKLLLESFLNRVHQGERSTVLIELSGAAMNMASYLELQGFIPHSETFSFSLKDTQ
jgi:GNAT superfamily N-acetyltransferase